MSSDIESTTKNCRACRTFGKANTKEKITQHTMPELPFQKIGADVCEVEGKNYTVIVDYFSKWIEVKQINSKTAAIIIKVMKTTFATHGIPERLIADNMPFASAEFREFAKSWNFEINTSSPRNPQSNGMAEKAVHIVKQMIKKCKHDKKDMDLALLAYRNTPVAGLPYSPAQLLINRQQRTNLPITTVLLEPRIPKQAYEKLKEKQSKVKARYDRTAREKQHFEKGQKMYIRNKDRWEAGKIVSEHDAPQSYIVEDEDSILEEIQNTSKRENEKKKGKGEML